MEKVKVCFAASTGGHYEQLMMLRPIMNDYESFILTEKTSYKLGNDDIPLYTVPQLNRKEFMASFKLLIVCLKQLYIYCKEKPDVIITTGVLSMIPICVLAKLCGKKLIYIESFAKIKDGTKTGKLLYKIADVFYVQWESMLEVYPKAIYLGGIY